MIENTSRSTKNDVGFPTPFYFAEVNMPSISYHLLTLSRAFAILELQKQIFPVGFGE